MTAAKKLLILWGFLVLAMPGIAQHPTDQPVNSAPEWVYAEIIANHLPFYKGSRVMIDLGQETDKWKYNYVNSTGEIIQFNSAVEALNHMTAGGWEFVQAYTSGEDNDYTHYLLRMRSGGIGDPQSGK